MSIFDISRDAVLQALDEFDEIGRERFLEKYGFGEAKTYFVRRDGRYYDSKAVVGAAHGYEFPDEGPLKSNEFSGGVATVGRVMERLGFEFVETSGDSAAGRSAVLYYWHYDFYSDDESVGDTSDFVLNQDAPRFGDLKPGDSVWAFTRRPDGEYVLAAELVIAETGENEEGHPFGRYRVVGDVANSRFFGLDDQEGFEELVREELSIRANGNPLGRAFQGHAAVRGLSDEDQRLLEAYANEVPLLVRERPSGNEVSGAFEELLSRFPEARRSRFSRVAEIWEPFQTIESGFEEWVSKYDHLDVQWSAGKGNWAQVPWVALLDERETDSIRQGVYVCYLFREDMSGIFLTLLQGVTAVINEHGTSQGYPILRKRGEDIRGTYPGLLNRGFSSDAIDLRATRRGPHYEAATIVHKLYPVGEVPGDTELYDDLHHLLRVYDDYAEKSQEPEPPAWWREKVADLSVGYSKGERSVYKPLLILELLSRALRGESHRVGYEDIAEGLRDAMERFGADFEQGKPADPFWHLQGDGLWEVVDAEGASVDKSYNETPGAWIRETTGVVPEEYWQALVEDEVLVLELVDLVLSEYWPADEHDKLRDCFGLYLEPDVNIDLATTVSRFADDLRESGISFGADHEDFVRTLSSRFAASVGGYAVCAGEVLSRPVL